jgi:hypothetical protein
MRSRLSAVVAVAVVLAIGLATRLPAPPAVATAGYQFVSHTIPSVPVAGFQTQRQFEPQLRKIAWWMSGLGAGVALADLEHSGRPQDVCLSDPRTDTVTVSAAGSGRAAFAPFVLDAAPLPYDRATMAPMGCLPGDFNEDGWTDLIVYYWGRTPVVFVRRPGVPLGPDAFVRRELVTPVQRWYTDALTSADVDGDGHVDLVVGNYFPDGARLLDPAAANDPATQMHDSFSNARNAGRSRILLWQSARGGPEPDVTFREAAGALPAGVATGWTLAIAAYDLTGDLLPALYFSDDFGPDVLLLNRSTPGHVRLVPLPGRPDLLTPKSKVLGSDSFKGMGVDFADLAGNGRPDMFVSNITDVWGLMESNFMWINQGSPSDIAAGRAPFVDRSEAMGLSRSGWGWDAKFGDFDNSGRQALVQARGFVNGAVNLWPQVSELALANDNLVHDVAFWPNIRPGADIGGHEPPAFFVPGAGGRWADAGAAAGLAADVTPSRAVAIGDVDGNGRLDFAIARQWGSSSVYLNACADCGRSLELRLLLPAGPDAAGAGSLAEGAAGELLAGSPAIGAHATVTLPGGRRMTAQVDGGNGHAGVRAPELHFGLGAVPAGQPVDVALDWRDRSGAVHHQSLHLAPGRWTEVLGGVS